MRTGTTDEKMDRRRHVGSDWRTACTTGGVRAGAPRAQEGHDPAENGGAPLRVPHLVGAACTTLVLGGAPIVYDKQAAVNAGFERIATRPASAVAPPGPGEKGRPPAAGAAGGLPLGLWT